MTKHIRRPGYAEVVATLALVLAASGGAYAATQLPKNSVGSKQVRNSSLQAKDFRPGQLPAGARGPKGDPGSPGAPGAAGPSVLLAGHDSANGGGIHSTGCPIYAFESPIVVTQPTILDASGQVTFQALSQAVNVTHFPTLKLILHDAQHAEVGQTLQGKEYGPNNVDVRTSGLVVGADGSPVPVPPGSYTLELQVSVSSVDCSGTSLTSSPELEWVGFPAPA
jgi:hypothetical protein